MRLKLPDEQNLYIDQKLIKSIRNNYACADEEKIVLKLLFENYSNIIYRITTIDSVIRHYRGDVIDHLVLSASHIEPFDKNRKLYTHNVLLHKSDLTHFLADLHVDHDNFHQKLPSLQLKIAGIPYDITSRGRGTLDERSQICGLVTPRKNH